jgi:hypothetical protein
MTYTVLMGHKTKPKTINKLKKKKPLKLHTPFYHHPKGHYLRQV